MKQSEKATILIVDDRPNNLTVLQETLNSLKQTVIQANSGKEAINHINKQEFAVIILDVNMPEMNGFELANHIRNKSLNQYTPIIFITGTEVSEMSYFKGYELGAFDYLIKPIDLKIICSKVSVFVELFLQKKQLENAIEEITKANQKLEEQVLKFEEVQASLRHLTNHLENLVEQRTIQLIKNNANLKKEIKQRQDTEQSLRESKEFYRLILSNISDAILMTDEQGNFTYICPNADIIFGYSRQDIQQMKNIYRLFGRNFYKNEQLEISGEIINLERKIIDKFGKTHILLVNIKEVFINGRKILYTCRDITERKQAEESLQESEEKFRNIVTTTSDGLIVMNKSGHIYFVNPAAESFFGLNAVELSEYQWNFSPNHDSTEIAIDKPDGKLIFLEIKIVETIWNKELVYLVSLRDITERKQAEEALKISEKRYRNLINNLHAGVIVHGADTKILLSNSKASELLELPIEQMLGKTDLDLPWYFLRENGTKMPIQEYPVNSIMTTQKPLKNYVVGVNRPKSQTIVWHLVNAFGDFNSYGHINQVIVTFVDITKFKQAQEALQESNRRYVTLAQASPVGIFRTDTEGNCLYVNKRWQTIAGLTWQQALGKGWSQAIHPEDRMLILLEWEQVLNKNLPFQAEYRFQRPDGSVTWVYGQAIAETDEQGILKGYLGTITDISARKEAELKLQSLNDELEHKVEERTLHLQQVNQQLRQEIFERQQTEIALKKSEERFRAAFEQAAVGMVLVSLEGDFIKVNPKFCQMLNYSQEELLQTNILTLTYPEDKQQVLQVIEQLTTEKKLTLSFEKRFLNKKNKPIWAKVTISLVNGSSGESNYFIKIIEDINDKKRNEVKRKATEKALQKSEAQLRSMFEYAAVGIAFVDFQGKPFNSNPALQRFLGYSSQELTQMVFTEFTHPEDAVTDLTLYQDLFANNRDVYQLEKRYIRKDGQIVWGHLSVSLVRNNQGKPQFAIKMVEDISDAKRNEAERQLAEAALRENRAFLRNVIDTVPNFIFVKNNQGNYTLVNQALASAYGTTVKELEGKSDADFYVNPAEVNQARSNEEQVMNSLQSLLIDEQSLTLANGEVRYFQTLKTPLISPDGKAYYILGVATDITERKRTQQKIEKALAKEKELNELKTQFIDIVSHEFRTPLTSILGYTELLERHGEKLSTQKKLKHLHNISVAGQRLNDLIEDVLCISRSESGKLLFNPTPIKLKAFCQDLIEEIKIGIGQGYEIIFTEQKVSFNDSIALDEKLLRHILMNLLSNAIKYSSLGSCITLSLHYDNQQVIFEITDRGIGIPLEDRAKLFDSFYRASNVGNIPGTGLGLNIVQRYVVLQGGSIDFTSQVNVGTTFRVRLPIPKILC